VRILLGVASVVLAFGVSACGGGGGGSTGGGSVTVPPPIPASTPGIGSQSVQRSDVQSGLAGINAFRSYASDGSVTTFATARALRRELTADGPHALFSAPFSHRAATCTNDSETTYAPGSNGSVIFTIDDYYDAACTELQSSLVWTASQQGSSITGPATLTDYSTAGAVTETANANVTFAYTSSALTTLDGYAILLTSIVANNQQLGESGIACTVATASSASCGVAAATNIYSTSSETGANVTFAASNNSTQTSVSMQVSAYAGELNALSIAAGPIPTWVITPAADQTDSLSISGSENSGSSSFSLTLTDGTNGGSLAMSGAIAGSVNGTLTRSDTGATVATFTIDAHGDGTLTYASGTQVTILAYQVQG
jgi:hypothetical protein